MRPEQLALAAHLDQIVRDAGKVKGESDDHHGVESNDHPAATLILAIALGGLFAPAAARAGEYCSEDGYSFARAACLRDPFLKDDKIETIKHKSDTYLLCRPIARPIATGAAVRQR